MIQRQRNRAALPLVTMGIDKKSAPSALGRSVRPILLEMNKGRIDMSVCLGCGEASETEGQSLYNGKHKCTLFREKPFKDEELVPEACPFRGMTESNAITEPLRSELRLRLSGVRGDPRVLDADPGTLFHQLLEEAKNTPANKKKKGLTVDQPRDTGKAANFESSVLRLEEGEKMLSSSEVRTRIAGNLLNLVNELEAKYDALGDLPALLKKVALVIGMEDSDEVKFAKQKFDVALEGTGGIASAVILGKAMDIFDENQVAVWAAVEYADKEGDVAIFVKAHIPNAIEKRSEEGADKASDAAVESPGLSLAANGSVDFPGAAADGAEPSASKDAAGTIDFSGPDITGAGNSDASGDSLSSNPVSAAAENPFDLNQSLAHLDSGAIAEASSRSISPTNFAKIGDSVAKKIAGEAEEALTLIWNDWSDYVKSHPEGPINFASLQASMKNNIGDEYLKQADAIYLVLLSTILPPVMAIKGYINPFDAPEVPTSDTRSEGQRQGTRRKPSPSFRESEKVITPKGYKPGMSQAQTAVAGSAGVDEKSRRFAAGQ